MKSEYIHIVDSLIKKLRHIEGSGVLLLPRPHPAAQMAERLAPSPAKVPAAAATIEAPAPRPATRLVFAAPYFLNNKDESDLLDKIIAATGLKKDEVGVAYPLPGGAGSLMDEVKAACPGAVIALGPEAASQLAGLAGDFEGLRGKLHLVEGITVLATSSIKSLVEDPAQKKRAWSEIKLVLNALGVTPGA